MAPPQRSQHWTKPPAFQKPSQKPSQKPLEAPKSGLLYDEDERRHWDYHYDEIGVAPGTLVIDEDIGAIRCVG